MEKHPPETVRLSHQDFADLSADALEQVGAFRFRAGGDSMRPFICDGDVLEVVRTSPDKLRRGEVALFRKADGQMLAHRLIGRNPDGWRARGDALWFDDGVVPWNQMVGKVVRRERHGKIRSIDQGVLYWGGYAWMQIFPLRWLWRRVGCRLSKLLRKTT